MVISHGLRRSNAAEKWISAATGKNHVDDGLDDGLEQTAAEVDLVYCLYGGRS
jgi:hypothetical protein